MTTKRRSGILLHITSLPGPWGLGELGPHARSFGQFLARSGQTLWQILPTNPVDSSGSSYSSNSAFAGNPLLISFDELLEEGLLTRRHLSRFPQFDAHKIDFPAVTAARMKVLRGVCDRFEPTREFEAFCEAQAHWLEDYALFATLRDVHDQQPWTAWPAPLRDRDPRALDTFCAKRSRAIQRHRILQYLFDRHWNKFKASLRAANVQLIGDVPIFVAADSADVWAHRDLFLLDSNGAPHVVAGVPPDYFSKTGQRWGNPLYDWPAHRTSRYAWWTARMRRSLELVDAVRIDHFRGFEAHWEIPAQESTAIRGRWVKGPGASFFREVERNLRASAALGPSFRLSEHVIAEDLGLITEEVEALRKACGFPGMTVLQFRFGADAFSKPHYRPEGDEDRVVYTGTHDNETTRRWFDRLDEQTRHRVRVYLQTHGDHIHRDLAELAMRSPARTAILPLQDVLGKGRRMNTPGTTRGNWDWRVTDDLITRRASDFLKETTQRNGRGR